MINQASQDRVYEAWPMVHPPLEWVFDEEGKVSERGGYLTLHPGKYSTVIVRTCSIPETALALCQHAEQSIQR